MRSCLSKIVLLISMPVCLIASRAKADEPYRGWAHVSATVVGTAGESGVKSTVTHVNFEDGTFAMDIVLLNGEHVIDLFLPSLGESHHYSSATNEITIKKLRGSELDAIAEQSQSQSILIDSIIPKFSQNPYFKPTISPERLDGEWARIDIDIPALSADGDLPAMPPAKSSFWFDPKTRHMHKAFTVQGENSVEILYTYGEPTFDEIYDFSIARDTKVIDNRIKKEDQEVLARLRARFERSYGTYVALLTTYELDQNGKPMPTGSVALLAETEDGDMLCNICWVGGDQKTYYPSIQLEGWPTPTLENALKALKGASPIQYGVFIDGKTGATGYMSNPPNGYDITTFEGKNASAIPDVTSMLGLASKIWPRMIRSPFDGPGIVSIKPAKDHPEWTELSIESDPVERAKISFSFTFDPARDDVAVSEISKREDPAQPDDNYTHTIQYSNHVQLPSGTWYPTEWIDISEGAMTGTTKMYSRLQIFEGKTLEENLYRELIEKK